ncbi:MAG: hypothetical protein ABH859_07845 [Pseudomonadota bacterium]
MFCGAETGLRVIAPSPSEISNFSTNPPRVELSSNDCHNPNNPGFMEFPAEVQEFLNNHSRIFNYAADVYEYAASLARIPGEGYFLYLPQSRWPENARVVGIFSLSGEYLLQQGSRAEFQNLLAARELEASWIGELYGEQTGVQARLRAIEFTLAEMNAYGCDENTSRFFQSLEEQRELLAREVTPPDTYSPVAVSYPHIREALAMSELERDSFAIRGASSGIFELPPRAFAATLTAQLLGDFTEERTEPFNWNPFAARFLRSPFDLGLVRHAALVTQDPANGRTYLYPLVNSGIPSDLNVAGAIELYGEEPLEEVEALYGQFERRLAELFLAREELNNFYLRDLGNTSPEEHSRVRRQLQNRVAELQRSLRPYLMHLENEQIIRTGPALIEASNQLRRVSDPGWLPNPEISGRAPNFSRQN